MDWFADRAEVDILLTSGVLHVCIRPRPKLSYLLISAAVIVAFATMSAFDWRKTSVPERVIEVAGVLGAIVAWVQQLSGSEEQNEIGEREIRLSRDVFGWSRTSEFPIDQCSDLDIQTSKEDSRQLQFRFGKWRTIEFGNHMSREQAERVLDTLAREMPEIARKLLPSLDITQHWTTLNLN